MDGTIQNFTLDMAADTKKDPLEIKQYDTNSRWARISLVAFKSPWIIPFGCQIHISVRKTDGTLANATCTRETESTVLAPITDQMATVAGTHLGELYFLGNDGDIRSQTFPVVVRDAVTDLDRMASSDDFQVLKDALREVKTSTEAADIAAQYATEQGNSARDGAQRANDAADSIQVAVDAAAAAKVSETNAKTSETAAAQTQQEVTDYVEAQKAAFVGYSKRESDSKYANALTNAATGEGDITVEDAWTAPVLGLEVVGKSEQATTTGAQLLPQPQFRETKNGLTIKTQTDGGVAVTGTATTATAFTVAEILLEPGTYTLSGLSGLVVGRMYFQLVEISAQGGQFVGELAKVGHVASTTITIDRDVWARAEIKVLSGVTADSVCYPMLNVGITALPWEPYTGGAPSPSPDYPQDIISTGTVSTGKQLFYKSIVTLQGTGAEADIIDKRAIKITYARANGGKYAGFIVDDKINIIGETLTVSYSGIVSSKSGLTPGIRLYWIDNNGSVLSYVVYVNKSPTTITIEDPQNDAATKLALLLYADVGDVAVVNDYVIYKDIMINAGDTALPWEPYTGGKPSPSVEYPQTLEVGVTGAQLFDADKVTSMTAGGATVTNNGDGSFTVSGSGALTNKINRSILFTRDQTLTILRAGNYCMSGAKTYPYFHFTLYDTVEKTVVFEINTKGTPSKEITQALINNEKLVLRIGFYGAADAPITPGVVWPMVNVGDTALPWEPYRSATAPITLTEPLRGVGEYRYRIMCRDGVWGIERCVGVVDNGQWKKINVVSGSAGHRFVYDATDMIEKLNCMVMCTKYTRRPNGSSFSNAGDYMATDERGKIFIRTLNPDFETIEAFKEFMADAITIYPLATPTWEPLPSATQQALNALTTYAGTTHLTITAGGPAPTVTLDYVQDTHKALEQCQEAAKEYTDNQIAAIVAALPTATQAAIVDNQTTRLLQEV